MAQSTVLCCTAILLLCKMAASMPLFASPDDQLQVPGLPPPPPLLAGQLHYQIPNSPVDGQMQQPQPPFMLGQVPSYGQAQLGQIPHLPPLPPLGQGQIEPIGNVGPIIPIAKGEPEIMPEAAKEPEIVIIPENAKGPEPELANGPEIVVVPEIAKEPMPAAKTPIVETANPDMNSKGIEDAGQAGVDTPVVVVPDMNTKDIQPEIQDSIPDNTKQTIPALDVPKGATVDVSAIPSSDAPAMLPDLNKGTDAGQKDADAPAVLPDMGKGVEAGQKGVDEPIVPIVPDMGKGVEAGQKGVDAPIVPIAPDIGKGVEAGQKGPVDVPIVPIDTDTSKGVDAPIVPTIPDMGKGIETGQQGVDAPIVPIIPTIPDMGKGIEAGQKGVDAPIVPIIPDAGKGAEAGQKGVDVSIAAVPDIAKGGAGQGVIEFPKKDIVSMPVYDIPKGNVDFPKTAPTFGMQAPVTVGQKGFNGSKGQVSDAPLTKNSA